MIIILTGANGTLGSHLVPELKRLKYTVIQLDIEDFDIGNRSAVQGWYTNLGKSVNCAITVNCAAMIGLQNCKENKAKAYDTNYVGTMNLYSMAETYLEKSFFVQISTDYVYDGNENRLHTENEYTCPISYYAYILIRHFIIYCYN